jgi:hypothetical protein
MKESFAVGTPLRNCVRCIELLMIAIQYNTIQYDVLAEINRYRPIIVFGNPISIELFIYSIGLVQHKE